MNEENQVTDDNEQGIPVKTPERDEHSIIRGINILLAGIAGGSVSEVEGIAMLLGPSFINGFVIPNYLESENKGYLRTGMLVSSCATTVMPLLGAMFGAPNSDPSTVATIIFMGTIGGVIYNHGLALIFPKYREALKSAKFKRRKQPADSN